MMDRTSRPLSPGLLVVAGVEDLELIGRGGFARVYRGWQAEMRRNVAIKVLDGVADDPDSARRFRREVAAMGAASHHPNVVPVYATGVTDDGHPYLIMPFYSGGTLNERLVEGPLEADEVTAVGAKVAGALAAAHDTGVLHRDVKPSNILFSAYGEPLLADFGIARLADSTLTNSNVVAATIAYAAPESLSGQHIGPAADVYSLGATLYAALTGVPPFVIGPDETLAAFVARAVTQPPADLPSNVPAPLVAAIERAMAKEPGLRTVSAARFEDDLAAGKHSTATVPLRGDRAEAPPATPANPLPAAPAAAPPLPASAARSDGAAETSPPDGAAVAPGEAVAVSGGGGDVASGGPGEGANRRRRALAAIAAAVVAVLVIALIAYRSQTSTKPKAAPSSPSAPSTARASTAPASTAPQATSAPTTARPSTAPSTTAPPPATSTPTTVRAVVPISPPSVPSTTTPTSPPSAPAGGAPGAATIPDTVNRYYSLLPTGAVDGFRWLSPAYQQRVGFDAYRAFWGSIKTVDVVDVVPQGSNAALVSLRYNGADERHLLTFVRDPTTGNFLIDAYE